MRGGRDLAPCVRSAVQSRPRTMIAWNAARTQLWLIVVGGRARGVPVSRYGLSYRQVTEVARSLGASEAVMVDGGGSSTMAVRAGREVQRVDAPAEAPQRPVPDALVLVRK
jgi:exopolysaccharide biosynthesis protein